MPGQNRHDPYMDYRFRVEIDGIQQVAFRECSGLGSLIEVVEYREGSEPNEVRKLPGRVRYPDIVLKRGVTPSRDLYDWHRQVIIGNLQRKNGAVILLDDGGAEIMRWVFRDAWPSKFEGPTLEAKGTDVAIETLTLTVESMELAVT